MRGGVDMAVDPAPQRFASAESGAARRDPRLPAVRREVSAEPTVVIERVMPEAMPPATEPAPQDHRAAPIQARTFWATSALVTGRAGLAVGEGLQGTADVAAAHSLTLAAAGLAFRHPVVVTPVICAVAYGLGSPSA